MDTLLQKQLEEKCFAFYTHLLEFHWWLFLVVTLVIWWQMDFDGFILEYAADGVECEGEIWIYNFEIPALLFCIPKRQDKLQKTFFVFFYLIFIIYLNSFSIDEIMNYWME